MVGLSWHEPCNEVKHGLINTSPRGTDKIVLSEHRTQPRNQRQTSPFACAFQTNLVTKTGDDGCPVAPTTRLSQTRRSTYSTFIQSNTWHPGRRYRSPGSEPNATMNGACHWSSRDRTDRGGYRACRYASARAFDGRLLDLCKPLIAPLPTNRKCTSSTSRHSRAGRIALCKSMSYNQETSSTARKHYVHVP